MKSARLLGVAGAALPFVLSVIVLHCLLVLPNHPAAMTPGALGLFPLELPLVIAALLALGERKTLVRVLCGAFAVVLTVATVLKSADLVTYEALSRAFNPVTDLPLVVAATRLLVSTLGTPLTIAAVLTAILSALLLAAFVYCASRTWAKVAVGRPWRLMAGGVAVCFALVCVADTGHVTGLWRLPVNPPGTAFTTRLAYEELAESTRSLRELAAFRIVSQSDPYGDQRELFNKLDARNVVLIFLESYGRASFANPLYATTHLATLETAERELAAVGLAIRSGWLESPISGGQSWLAHGTLASGLRIADQSRYGAMLASPRQTLFHLAQAAGYRTIAVMPAITLPWPEGPRMGFETILTARNMGYRGQSFNWVTMPDQFTLATYPSRLDVDPRPDFVQVALISSHAPWIPIPPMIAWETIGDGKVFDQWAQSGESPAELWRDRDRVRDQYRLAVDYTLRTSLSFVARHSQLMPQKPPLMIVLGDHPPAEFVSQINSKDVPIHVIGPPELIAMIDDWGWADGLVPQPDTPVWPMEAFRDRFIGAFTALTEGESGS